MRMRDGTEYEIYLVCLVCSACRSIIARQIW